MSSGLETMEMSRAEWLGYRRSHIGGSDVAAIMGLSPWRTAYQVWAEKTGVTAPEDISDRPRVEWGTRLEDEIARKFNDTHGAKGDGLWVIRPNANGVSVYVDANRPWAMATLDGVVSDGTGRLSVYESKTAHFPSSKDWDTGVPAHYLAQVNHYLGVTGWDRAYVVVLIDGWDYREYVVNRDEADVRAVRDAVDAFWHEHVEAGVAPEATHGDATALLDAHPESNGDYLPGDFSQLELVEAWREAKSMERRAKGEARALESRLRQQIGDAEGLEFPEGRLRWSRYMAERFDSKRLREEEPDVYARYATARKAQRLTWRDA